MAAPTILASAVTESNASGTTTTTAINFTPPTGTKTILLFAAWDGSPASLYNFSACNWQGASGAAMQRLAASDTANFGSVCASAVFAIHDPDLAAGEFYITHNSAEIYRAFIAVALDGYVLSATGLLCDDSGAGFYAAAGVMSLVSNTKMLSFFGSRGAVTTPTAALPGTTIVESTTAAGDSMYAGIMKKDTGMDDGSNYLGWATVTNNLPAHYIVLLQPTKAGSTFNIIDSLSDDVAFAAIFD